MKQRTLQIPPVVGPESAQQKTHLVWLVPIFLQLLLQLLRFPVSNLYRVDSIIRLL